MKGLPELQAKYKEFTYAFQNTDTNDLFLENPEFYINTTNGPLDSPPMRLCILGPQGCGKTTQAKRIAEDNNTFHVRFRFFHFLNCNPLEHKSFVKVLNHPHLLSLSFIK